MKRRKFTIKTLILVFMMVYAVVIIIKQENATLELNDKIKAANEQLETANSKKQQLQDELNMANSDIDAYREKQAKERLGYVKENETPVLAKPESK